MTDSRLTHDEFKTATSYHCCSPQLRKVFRESFLADSSIDSSAGNSGGTSIGFSEGWVREKQPWQQWLIWYLWENFLVSEHRIPIWVILRLRFCVEDIVEDTGIDNISLYMCINTNIVKCSHGCDSLYKSTPPFKTKSENIVKC